MVETTNVTARLSATLVFTEKVEPSGRGMACHACLIHCKSYPLKITVVDYYSAGSVQLAHSP